jgi:peptide/nickel transport system substrate-binding protein
VTKKLRKKVTMLKTRHVLALVGVCIVVVAAVTGYMLWPQPEQIQVKEELVIVQGSAWSDWDPSVVSGDLIIGEISNVVEPLIRWEVVGEEYKPMPCLATSWTMINLTAWEFKLREGVKFHCGRELTAWDVKATYEKVINPQHPTAFRTHFVPRFKYFEVVDNYTYRMGGDIPNGKAADVNHMMAGILCMHCYNGTTRATAANCSGTGPYKFVELKTGEYVKLERFDDYWNGTPANRIKRITIKFIPDSTTRIIALEAGEVDYVYGVPPGDMERLAQENFTTHAWTGVRQQLLCINTLKPPFNDTRVRQAINYAIDRTTIVEELFAGLATPATSITSQNMMGYYQNWPTEYNVTRAKALLAEAGYPNGFDCTISTSVGRWLMDKVHVETIAAYLANVGIRARVETYDWTTYTSLLTQEAKKLIPDLDIYFWGWGVVDFAIPGAPLTRPVAYNGTCNYNVMAWYDIEFEELLARFEEVNATEFPPLYTRMHEILLRDMPAIPLVTETILVAHVPELENDFVDPRETVRLANAYFVAKSSKSASASLGSSLIPAAMLPLSNVCALSRLPKRCKSQERQKKN